MGWGCDRAFARMVLTSESVTLPMPADVITAPGKALNVACCEMVGAEVARFAADGRSLMP